MSEPFRFSDLPYEMAFHILRDYVPVEDKDRLLTHLPDFFSPYLRKPSCWHPTTLRLFELATRLPPGWYVRPLFLDFRLHVTVDYEHLFFAMQYFVACVPAKPLAFREEETLSLTDVQRHYIHEHDPKVWHAFEGNDLLHYQYRPSDRRAVSFWIWTASRRVVWSGWGATTLENNRCVVEDAMESFSLEFRDDFQVVLDHRVGDLLNRRDVVLIPIRYYPSAVGAPPLPKTLFPDPTSGIHPFRIQVFRQGHGDALSWMQYRVYDPDEANF